VNGYRGAPVRAVLRGVADEPGQVSRLHAFRTAHPDVIIGPDEFRNWQARILEPNGERVIVRYRLWELLNKLDELTAECGGEPGGGPG
jgi:hypothetical protein